LYRYLNDLSEALMSICESYLSIDRDDFLGWIEKKKERFFSF